MHSDIIPRFGERLTILAIARDHDQSEVSSFLTKKKYPFLFAPDPDRKIYHHFATRFVPRNYLVNQKLELLYQDHGFDPDDTDHLLKCLEQHIR